MKSLRRKPSHAGRRRKRTPRPKPPHLSDDIRGLLDKADGNAITLGEILASFPTRSHALLFVFFGVPLSSPIGIPVFTTVLGPTLALVSVFLLLGRKPWLPPFLRHREVSADTLAKVGERLLRVSLRVEKLLKPRLVFMGTVPPLSRLHGAFALVMSLTAALPITIPFGNTVAALPIVLLGLGLLERDGLFILLAYLGAIPCIAFYATLLFLGGKGVEQLIHRFF